MVVTLAAGGFAGFVAARLPWRIGAGPALDAGILGAVPALLLAILVIGMAGREFAAVAAGLAAAPLAFARAYDRARALAASRHAEFARITGIPNATLMRRDLIYDFRDTFLTSAARALAAVTITLSTVSFLGFGAVPPHRDLGLMIAAAVPNYLHAWWTAAFPALALLLVDPVRAAGGRPRRRREPMKDFATPPAGPAGEAAPDTPFLHIDSLGVTRPGAARPALDRFSLTIAKGETVVLLGEAGCGKEALMRVLGGLPDRGDSSAARSPLPAPRPCAPAGVCITPRQSPILPGPSAAPLSPNATVLSQLVRVLARRLRAPRSSAKAELELALGRMAAAPGLPALDALPGQIEPDVIAWGLLATTFAQTPEFVLADHPLAGIAPLRARALARAIKAEQARLGFTLLYAAMGTEVAAVLGGRTLVLRHGRIVEEGPLARLASSQAHAYTRTLFRDWAGDGEAPRNAGRGEPVLRISGLEIPRRKGAPPGRPDTLNFELRRGAALALVGEQGSGRRALVRRIIGLDRAGPGRVVMDAVDIGILSEAMLTRLRRRVAYITGDDDALDPRMTIWDTVGEPLRAHLGLPRDVVAGYREAALKRVGLASLPGNRAVARLSAFDKRRLQVARAIVTAPLLAIVDEPLSGLDAFAQSVMRDLLRTFRTEEGPAFLLVTADFSVARALAEAAFVFQDGQIVERGTLAEIMQAPRDIATRTLIEAVSSSAPDGVS